MGIKIITTGVLLIKALKNKTIKRVTKIIIVVLFEKNPRKLVINPFSTRV